MIFAMGGGGLRTKSVVYDIPFSVFMFMFLSMEHQPSLAENGWTHDAYPATRNFSPWTNEIWTVEMLPPTFTSSIFTTAWPAVEGRRNVKCKSKV